MALDPEVLQQIQELKKQIDNLRTGTLYQDHFHNGSDFSRVRFSDLDTVFYGTATIDPGNLADGAGETDTITVKGATLGDFAFASAPYDLVGITVTAYVSANDTVKIRIQNESGGAVDLASGLWRAIVLRKVV
jgi:hypothetical protein